jgi:hypothetical protein
MQHLDQLNPEAGLYPLLYSLHTGALPAQRIFLFQGQPISQILTLGSNSDSFYEYLLKQWLQSNKTDINMRILYDEAVQVFK